MTKRAADLEAEAGAWLARRDGGAWTEADDAALREWRKTSTAHHIALLRLETAWSKADRLRVLAPDHAEPAAEAPIAAPPPARRWQRYRYVSVLAAAAALAALAIPAWRLLHGPAADAYATSVGGFQRVPLADGSRLDINTNTHLDVALGNRERHISLDQGEAFFTVAHDRARPFVVEAGDFRVTAVGTAFSVRRDGNRLVVAVTEGRVRIDRRDAAGTAPLVFVSAGQRITAASDAPIAVQTVDRGVLEQDLSWRDGLLTFDEMPLRDVVAEFNRYNTRRLVADPAVAQIRISGTFRANNVEGFTRLLREGFRVSATAGSDGALLLRPS